MAHFFGIFHALSFKLNYFFDRRFPLSSVKYRMNMLAEKFSGDFCRFLIDSVWQNLASFDIRRPNPNGVSATFRSSKALLTNQELRLKNQRQQIVHGLY